MCNNRDDAKALGSTPEHSAGQYTVSTSASSAGSTAKVSMLVQRGGNFLSARPGSDDYWTEDCAARATVVLTRSRSFTVVLSPLDMFGLVGMAQTLGAYTNVMGMATPRYHTLSLPEEYDEMAVIRTLSISSAPDWCQLPLSVVRFHLDEQDKTTIHRTRLHLILVWPDSRLRKQKGGHWQAAIRSKHRAIPRQFMLDGALHPLFLYGYAPDKCQFPAYLVMPLATSSPLTLSFLTLRRGLPLIPLQSVLLSCLWPASIFSMHEGKSHFCLTACPLHRRESASLLHGTFRWMVALPALRSWLSRPIRTRQIRLVMHPTSEVVVLISQLQAPHASGSGPRSNRGPPLLLKRAEAVASMAELDSIGTPQHLSGEDMRMAIREISCLPVEWPWCKIQVDVSQIYRHVTRWVRIEMIERFLRIGEREAWNWLEEMRSQITLHFAAFLAQFVVEFLLPAKSLALDHDVRTRAMFASGFWYRAIVQSMASLQYGLDQTRTWADLKEMKQHNDTVEPHGLVKLLFEPKTKQSEILSCMVNRLVLFIPCAWLQPIVSSFEAPPEPKSVKFIRHDNVMWLLSFQISDPKPHNVLPDLTPFYEACKEAFVSGLLNNDGARLFVNREGLKWNLQIPIYHSEIPTSADVVPKHILPKMWPIAPMSFVLADRDIHHRPHHAFLAALNIDPEQLTLVDIATQTTLFQLYFASNARWEDRQGLSRDWDGLHTNYDLQLPRSRLPFDRWKFDAMLQTTSRLPHGFGYVLADPYMYLTHLTMSDSRPGYELFPAPTMTALAAAQPSDQKDMLGAALYPRVAKLAPARAPKITGMLLERDNMDILNWLDNVKDLENAVALANDILDANVD